jgi:hypothetical protein
MPRDELPCLDPIECGHKGICDNCRARARAELPPFMIYVVEVETTIRAQITLPARSIEAAEKGAQAYLARRGGQAIVVEEVAILHEHTRTIRVAGPLT